MAAVGRLVLETSGCSRTRGGSHSDPGFGQRGECVCVCVCVRAGSTIADSKYNVLSDILFERVLSSK